MRRRHYQTSKRWNGGRLRPIRTYRLCGSVIRSRSAPRWKCSTAMLAFIRDGYVASRRNARMLAESLGLEMGTYVSVGSSAGLTYIASDPNVGGEPIVHFLTHTRNGPVA